MLQVQFILIALLLNLINAQKRVEWKKEHSRNKVDEHMIVNEEKFNRLEEFERIEVLKTIATNEANIINNKDPQDVKVVVLSAQINMKKQYNRITSKCCVVLV